MNKDKKNIIKVAVVQAKPVFLDLAGSIEKCCKLIKEAGSNGAQLIVFPETFIPTYPFWVRDQLDRSSIYEAFNMLFKNSLEIPSKETDQLCQAAKNANCWAVIGINERDTVYKGSIYNTNIHISSEGLVAGKHQKLIPTFTEKAIWGRGDGSGLLVHDTEFGRLGSLICYEHHMSLIKYAMYTKAEQIHCATWPGLNFLNHVVDAASRQYAFEGQTFVLASASILEKDDIPGSFSLKDQCHLANGGSGIISPLGEYISGPIYDEEVIIYADLELDLIIQAKHIVDATGHYQRPDVARLWLNSEHMEPVEKMAIPSNGSYDSQKINELYTSVQELKEELIAIKDNISVKAVKD